MSVSTGTRIGPYEVLSAIGAGGMGEVYRARDSKLNRDVAIKVLPELFAADPERLARFEREAQVLASLNHPNIAQIYGMEVIADASLSGARAASHALVMELVPGRTLREIIQAHGRGLPLPDALAIARQLADALEAAHDQGIIHRDLKPANIKVRDDGTVKVLDFGLAKALTQDQGPGTQDLANSPTLIAGVTQMGAIIGTAAYMAPEQARGRGVDRRADIWAFGLILFEMLAGRRAFEGDDVSMMLAGVLKDEIPWAALPADVPPRVRRLLRRCLQKDPRKRLSAIGDARFDLDEADDVADATVTPERAPPRARTPWLLMAGAMAVGMLIGAVGLSTLLRPAATPASIRRLSVIAPEGAALFPASGESAVSPDGTLVAFVTGSDTAMAASQLWVRRLDAPRAKLIEGAAGAHLPFWSPDNRRLGFFAEGKLKIVPAEGGRINVLCDAPDGRGATWSPRGVIVFAPASAGPLQRIPVDGGDPSPVQTLDASGKETAQRFPFFLPDGTHYLFTSIPARNGQFDIFVGELDSLNRTKILQAESAAVYVDPGYLVFSIKEAIVVQAFDAKALRVTGEPSVLDDTPGDIGTMFLSAPAASAAAGAIVYLSDPFADTTLAWVDRAGRETGAVEAPAGRYFEVDLAPDGQHASVVKQISVRDSSIWTIDLVRHGATKIADAPHFNFYVAWSPDGTLLAFANDGRGQENIFVRDAVAATPIAPLYTSADLFKKPLAWTPDGRLLLFSQLNPDTAEDLMTVPATGGAAATPYLHDPFNERSGRISPDGHWVAYISDESGSNDVYVRSFPTPDKKYRVTTDGGTAVRWKRDGSALLMTGADSRQLKLADVRLGPTLSTSAPRIVGSLPPGILTWDAAGDLEHLLVATPSGDAKLSLTVVSDWIAGVKKR